MLEVFFAPTPNGWKLSILVEELVESGKMSREDFKVVGVNLGKGEQFTEEFLSVSPNGRIPAIRDGAKTVFESGACLMYVAEKWKAFFPEKYKYEVLQWLFWQVGGLGPMAGQVSHFVNYAPLIDEKADHTYPLERYKREYKRLLSVMDVQLGKTKYLACDEYTIADMASYGWIIPYRRFGVEDLSEMPNLQRWFDELKNRPAVRRGVETLKNENQNIGKNAKTSKNFKDVANVLFKKSKM
ncbi:Glutathione S-transferase [Hondaea fermentalgiana]|uniref:Glutathione S-transferase n=1 Tax=Hondaea fermentalgiana TaxID=2315210 RepID=A0A2R5GEL3_9STRA|nr:Glutathione S-transferase [Hondaea fermentalgiana]|eukprot:GBG29366.1 Glutathione S-transferase [Hondaea fermentalgiana]